MTTGTWTRTARATANFGPDIIYSNTANSRYFATTGGNGGFAPGSTNFDEGQLPSSQNTNNPGDRDNYSVNCVRIAYCDFGTAAADSAWELSFYTSYTPCTFDAMPDVTLVVDRAPSNGCLLYTSPSPRDRG